MKEKKVKIKKIITPEQEVFLKHLFEGSESGFEQHVIRTTLCTGSYSEPRGKYLNMLRKYYIDKLR